MMGDHDFNLPRAGLRFAEQYIGWGNPNKPVDLSEPLALVMEPSTAAAPQTLALCVLVCAAVAVMVRVGRWADRQDQYNREVRIMQMGLKGAFK